MLGLPLTLGALLNDAPLAMVRDASVSLHRLTERKPGGKSLSGMNSAEQARQAFAFFNEIAYLLSPAQAQTLLGKIIA